MHITQYIITCLLICNALFFGYDTVIAQKVNLSGIINNYARVLQLDNCKNYIKVDNSFGFEAGDKAILIQLKGASINTDDSSTFGDMIDFKGAGNAEVVEISSVQNDLINLKYSPLLDYYPSDAPVQLVSLPGYDTATITSKLTAKPWDGLTGGVLAFDIRLALDISGTIDISGRGYRGGSPQNAIPNKNQIYSALGYRYSKLLTDSAGEKGEGIAILKDSYASGRGAPANAGGGGNAHNSGGGGGGNGGDGGKGSLEFGGTNFDLGGRPGRHINYDTFIAIKKAKIFMGGGGGGGHHNNQLATAGGAGGGIAYIRANNMIIRQGAQIFSNGDDVFAIAGNDGSGGGGAGGTIFFDVQRFIFFDSLQVQAKGGVGGSNNAGGNHGPGGGGGGGIVSFLYVKPPQITPTISGGFPGTVIATKNTHTADTGKIGKTYENVQLAESRRTALSVRNAKDTTVCANTLLNLWVEPSGGRPPFRYLWTGPNIDDPLSQYPNVRPSQSTTYNVSITDSFDCVIMGRVNVVIRPAPKLDIPIKTYTACKGDTIVLTADSPEQVYWYPSKGLLEDKGSKVHCIVDTNTLYTVQVLSPQGCPSIDTIFINLLQAPTISGFNKSESICPGDSISLLQISTINGNPPFTMYWHSSEFRIDTLNTDFSVLSYTVKPGTSVYYHFTLLDGSGCKTKDSVLVSILPIPDLQHIPDTIVCKNGTIQLWAKGGFRYSWTPSEGLSDSTSANPLASPVSSTNYTVTAFNDSGCSVQSSIFLKVVDSPLKPILIQKDDTLFAGAINGRFQWYRNNNTITGATDSLFIIDSAGFYKVEVYTPDNCIHYSDSVFCAIGTALLTIGNASISNGEIAVLPISLMNQQDIQISKVNALEITMSWNSSIASFERIDPKGSQISLINEADSTVFSGIFPITENQTLLGNIYIKGLLGDNIASNIHIRSYKPKNGILKLNKQDGLIGLNDICYEGGIRLWKSDKTVQRAFIQIAPQPINDKADIHLLLPEKGQYTLKAITVTGEIIPLIQGYSSIGYSHHSIDCKNLPSGVLQILLQTPTESIMESSLIIR